MNHLQTNMAAVAGAGRVVRASLRQRPWFHPVWVKWHKPGYSGNSGNSWDLKYIKVKVHECSVQEQEIIH